MRGINPALLASGEWQPPLFISTSGILNGGGELTAVTYKTGGGTGWGDGVPYGTRPIQSTPITISGANNVVIDNLFFDGLTYGAFQYSGSNSHVCISVMNSTNVTITNCDFLAVSECVQVYQSSNVTVEWNRCNGITGPGERVGAQTGNFLQTHGTAPACSYVYVRNNKIIAMYPYPPAAAYDPWGGTHELGPEDVISFFGASNSIAQYNQIDATGYQRDFGTGTILGDAFGDDAQIRDNTYLNPGQVGIAVAGGFNHVMDGNVIIREAGQVPGSGNTLAYYWDYNGNGIGGGVVSNNRGLAEIGGTFWNPGGATEINNNWNDTSLNPSDYLITL